MRKISDNLWGLVNEVEKVNKRFYAKFKNITIQMKKVSRFVPHKNIVDLPFVSLTYRPLGAGLKFKKYQSKKPDSYTHYTVSVGCLCLCVTKPKSWQELGTTLLRM